MININKIIFFDGAMGTMLQKRGLKAGSLPELLNITNPELIIDIHKQYIAAGCDIIKTNTFGANSLKLAEYPIDEIVCAAVKNARIAAGEKKVALDVGPTGKLLEPMGSLPFEKAYEAFSEVMRAGQKGGADLVLIETMNDTYELKAAVLAAKENTDLPVYATVTLDESGKLLTGADVKSVVALLEGLGVDALGINCGLGPKQFKKLFLEMKEYASIPIILQPNAGLPKINDEGETYFEVEPEEFSHDMFELASLGASIMGGCCGTTPKHIEQMIEKSKNITPPVIEPKNHTIVSSYGQAVTIGEKPVIIGERINPTGKKLLKQALRDKDMDYITGEAYKQAESGAHILDVNVGLPEIDEKEMMAVAVKEIQKITPLPLQIDSSDPSVIENALRIYNGKALINSVNGKQENMEAIFPLVKKYGGVVVALTLDEKGIPETAQGRLEIAEKIVKTAQEFGIEKKDILVDTLTMTVSSDEKQAQITLEALKLIKEKLGVKTVLGVSNVSFGLPNREIITSTFYTMALFSGLDAAIINPCSAAVMNSYYSYNALSGHDMQCSEYISKNTAFESEKPVKDLLSLSDIIIKGLKDKASDATHKLLETTKPLDVINNYLIPALDIVGNGYETGKIFLPQLFMSADAAKISFDAIKEHMAQKGIEVEKKEKIVLATVKGDVHDIGKNIVKVLLENYGYDVIDLGKNVDIQTVLDTVKEHDIKLLGLSALMTTTVASMKDTIAALREVNTECKVMVGGAVLTEEYAQMIGADFYSKDATGAVAIAQKLFGHSESESANNSMSKNNS